MATLREEERRVVSVPWWTGSALLRAARKKFRLDALNAFLTVVARSLETAHPGEPGLETNVDEAMVKPLDRSKLLDAALDIVQLAMAGQLPPQFEKDFKAHLETMKDRPHLGLWAPAVKPAVSFDYSALAVFVDREKAQYLREMIAARDPLAGVSHWSSTSALYPWLADERAALTKLSSIGGPKRHQARSAMTLTSPAAAARSRSSSARATVSLS